MGYTKAASWPNETFLFGQKSNTNLMRYKYRQRRTLSLLQKVTIVVVGFGIVGGGLFGFWGWWWHQSATSTTPDPGHVYGIAAGGSLSSLSDDELDKRMAGIAELGTTWVRFDFNWGIIQPTNANDFQWSQYDRLVSSAQKYHLHVLGILDFTPAWARASDCQDSDKCPPADNAQFAKFAAATAHRYKSQGLHFWEIWNEPNNPQFWQPGADPIAYAGLLKKTSSSLRKEDKQAYIITAGLSPQPDNATSYSPIAFLTAFYKVAAKDSFDAVGDHPYTFPLSPKDNADHAWSQMANTKSSLRQTMVANGDSKKKIWITEFGSPTDGPGAKATIGNPNLSQHPYVVDEALQSKILSDALIMYKSYDWTGPFFYYSYQDAGNTPDTNENYFGLVHYDGSKKPAYQVLQDAATQ